MRDELHLLRAWENIVRRGRNRGLGCTLITQRSAVLNKDVLTQVQTLIPMRTTGPQDVAAVAAWLKYHHQSEEILGSLAGLEDGEAWVWSPHFLKKTVRVRFRRRATFDSGATPKATESRRAPATLADVDLGAIQKRMAATIEKAKAEDPRELRRRIAELEKELKQRVKGVPVKAEPAPKRVEVPVLKDAQIKRLEKAVGGFYEAGNRIHQALERVKGLEENARAAAAEISSALRARQAPPLSIVRAGDSVNAAGRGGGWRPPKAVPESRARVPSTRGSETGRPGPAERAFLTILAQRAGKPLTRNQLAVFSGYSATSRHVDNTISALRSQGYLDGGRDSLLITDAGFAACPTFEPLPTGQALIDYWIREAGVAAGAMLKILVDVYPKTVTRDQLAEASGYSPTSRHVDNSISRLRTLELLTGGRDALRASDTLF
jgi:DNA-binding winged helix-turn-helix (wHTH) protein